MEKQIKNQARYAVQLKFNDLDEKTVLRARKVILDSVGDIFLGSKKPVGFSDSLENKILKWTNYMVDTELYEGNKFAVGHPACHILPLMLAVCEKKEISYKKFVTVFTIAYEIASRWGNSFRMPNYILGHGTVMTAGATVAYGLLTDIDEETLVSAIKISTVLPVTSIWQSVYDGSQMHNIYAGIAACNAIKAVEMAQNHFYVSKKMIENVYKDIFHADIYIDKLDYCLGMKYYLNKNYFKIHTGCRFIHMFADIVQEEIQKGLQGENVEKVEVLTYKKAAQIKRQDVSNALAAKFSTPVSLAVQLYAGKLTPDTIEQWVEKPEVKSLSHRIFLKEEEVYNRRLPDIRSGRIIISLKGGKIIDREVEHTDGDYDYYKPYTNSRLISKFYKCTGDMLNEDEKNELINQILLKDISAGTVNEVLDIFYKKF